MLHCCVRRDKAPEFLTRTVPCKAETQVDFGIRATTPAVSDESSRVSHCLGLR